MTPHPIRREAPIPDSPITRRGLLRGGAAAGAAVALGGSLSACDTGPTQRQRDAEALIPHARAAFRDQAAARQLAPRNTAYTEALTTVADQRGAHLTALRDEINRLHSSIADQIESTATSPTASVQALGSQIEQSATAAGRAAVAMSGFSAGLLGSISASCQTLAKVQLG
ncbi:twin-arginine translocation signal domain-containing protein [Gordonia hydrophobica]|uniref:Twin-arginine translocation signal domain-containing protein n=1 Tax=Gordonia hydrophobica TaxID=40516 RepID=A0ABZ2U106_9ACTN|nr:twin-arginine translocation signal domain-containing protein [Gordonia hydrophobica]MBM7367615.1 hypothetical protein [Gordonia hydrophobica]